MVRVGLIIFMLLCVTITGVYAAWTYAGTNDIADVYAEQKVTIADVELVGANGTYTITSNLVLTVDQANENHEAELKFAANNGAPIYLKVTFTPAANAPQDVKNGAVPTEVYFGTSTPMEYKIDKDGNYSETGTATPIFTFANPGNTVLDNLITWTNNGDGTFSYEMDQAALEAAISLSQTFVLDTKAEHEAFRIALSGNILVHVTDGTINK